MGAGHEVYCVDCRKIWYCGYCSYGNSHNYIARSPIAEHKALGHDTGYCTEDYTHTDEEGDLCLEGQYDSEKIVIGYKDFEYIDLSG
jgi:hypothetical protein